MITIVTPTIREGFWNIMSHSLSKQTYKDFLWLIVDDYPEDRSAIAEKYAQKYNITIKYIRSKKPTVKRRYGLVNANNSAIPHIEGTLAIWLQDFIILPPDALKRAWRVHEDNPTKLLAFVDQYYYPAFEPDLTNKEDWFNGETEPQGELKRQTHRMKGKGIYVLPKTEDACYIFEMNYCGIPTVALKVLNGWWECFDDGFGFDNTEFAYRAMKRGYDLMVDDKNVCFCIDHRDYLDEETGDVAKRDRNYNDPRFQFLADLTDLGKIPTIRDQKLDDKLQLYYEVPDWLPPDYRILFMRINTPLINNIWMQKYFPDYYKTL